MIVSTCEALYEIVIVDVALVASFHTYNALPKTGSIEHNDDVWVLFPRRLSALNATVSSSCVYIIMPLPPPTLIISHAAWSVLDYDNYPYNMMTLILQAWKFVFSAR
jgi:hypothetical protein